MPGWDIFGCGIVAVDDFLTVENYPPPDTKTPVLSKIRQGGGLTGTTLVAASRLGANCAYGGVLGGDSLSTWTIEELEREGVDCEPVIHQSGAQPFHSVIIVDQTDKTRTIFYSDADVIPRPLESIDESLIGQTRLLFIDHLGVDNMLYAAGIAKEMGIPTIADIELGEHPRTDALMAHIDHLILSSSFAAKFTGKNGPDQAVEHLATQARRTCTIVTAGDQGCWYACGAAAGDIRHIPAYTVQVVDTTGCGDVFHGAYAAGITWGWSISRCIRFASAAAAIKATKTGGRAGIPDRATVEQFLREREKV